MSRAILIHGADLSDGFHVQKIAPKVVHDGWDTVTVQGFYFAAEGMSIDLVRAQWALGEANYYGGGSTAWLVDIDVEAIYDGYLYNVKLTFKGVLQAKEMILSASAGSTENEAENVHWAGAVREKLRGLSAVPTVKVKYWQVGGPAPSMEEVGTNQTPPWLSAPVPVNPWSGVSRLTWIAPSGWVLVDRQPVGLPGNPPPALEITDVYAYRFANVPGGATS